MFTCVRENRVGKKKAEKKEIKAVNLTVDASLLLRGNRPTHSTYPLPWDLGIIVDKIVTPLTSASSWDIRPTAAPFNVTASIANN